MKKSDERKNETKRTKRKNECEGLIGERRGQAGELMLEMELKEYHRIKYAFLRLAQSNLISISDGLTN